MPELPEVETVCRGLEPFLVGHKVTDISVRSPSLRIPIPEQELKALTGVKIVSCQRRAKYILVRFANQKIMVAHLGMTGSYTVWTEEKQKAIILDRHDHLVFTTDKNVKIIYRDPRRFGSVDVINSSEYDSYKPLVNLGVEPLSDEFTSGYFHQKIFLRRAPVKPVLMDQSVVVGVGNIYASEALFMASIHPETPAQFLTPSQTKRLVAAIKKILIAAIESGGSTLRDYRRVGGESGHFQFGFSVYDRAGENCPRCSPKRLKAAGIQRIVQAGRSTFFCPTCQILRKEG